MLSPEGNTLDEMKALTRALVADGTSAPSRSTFHSPSVEPGHTPYVRSQADLDAFLGSIERYCEYFLGDLGGVLGHAARLPPASRHCLRTVSMKVLGISPLDKDSTVTLVEDGSITIAAGEERFTRVKLQDGFPGGRSRTHSNAPAPAAEEIDASSTRSCRGTRRRGCFERNLANEREFLEEPTAAATSD